MPLPGRLSLKKATVEEEEEEETNASHQVFHADFHAFGKEAGSVFQDLEEELAGLCFPSLTDEMLQQVRRKEDARITASDNPTESSLQETEEKFTSLALAFKTDRQTLDRRIELHLRARDVAEKNIQKELESLKDGIKALNQSCSSNQSMQPIFTKLQNHLEVLEQSITRMSSRAEVHGAVQQELRVSDVIETMVLHVENLKQTYQTEHKELQDARRSLFDVGREESTDGAGVSNVADKTNYGAVGSSKGSLRRISLALLAKHPKPLRTMSLLQSGSFSPSTASPVFSSYQHALSFDGSNVDSNSETTSKTIGKQDFLSRQNSIGTSVPNIKPAQRNSDINLDSEAGKRDDEKEDLLTSEENVASVSPDDLKQDREENKDKESFCQRSSMKRLSMRFAGLIKIWKSHPLKTSLPGGISFLLGGLSKFYPVHISSGFAILLLLISVVIVFLAVWKMDWVVI